ncbi:MAG: hypothetical protein IKN90_09070, partial [Treponema sp.]|nr:hypothetical protein [Treponema sp.]
IIEIKKTQKYLKSIGDSTIKTQKIKAFWTIILMALPFIPWLQPGPNAIRHPLSVVPRLRAPFPCGNGFAATPIGRRMNHGNQFCVPLPGKSV